MVLGSYFKLDNKVNTVDVKLSNHKDNHSALEQRVQKHEDKLDDELKLMNEKIDCNHKEVSEKLSDIKEAIAGLRK